MLYNRELLQDSRKLHYLIIERWSGIEARADYFSQAKALRRHMDALEYIEEAFRKNKVGMAHHLAGNAGTVVLAVLDSQEELGAFIKANPANARMRPDDRTVMPMGGWDHGREAFVQLIRNVERLAAEEEEAEREGKVRPFAEQRV
ncbi:hypothetical protein [Amycolatopsis sp. WGS_07]|uniref:hypothetical protein n=1 Tax=Amycolatopsis sp. WGS_07 TaxID=3076764 RepID=UPI0038731F00